MLSLLLLAGAARAHLPHDVVVALAAPPELDASAPWTLIADPGSVPLLLRSEDGGRSWSFLGGPPTVDDLSDAALLDDGWTVLLGEERLWWSADGQTWEVQELVGVSELEADGDQLLVAGPAGLGRLARGADPTWELDVAVRALASGAAVDGDGGVWIFDETWRDLGVPAADTASVVTGPEGTFAGTRSGVVWWHDGSEWSACGAVPDMGGRPDVVALALDGGVLYAAPAGRAPVASLDGCSTWVARDGLFTLYDTEGGAVGPDQAVTVLRAADGRVVAGGWAGLARSEDLGQSWTDAVVLPPGAARGVAFSPAFEADGTVYIGSYSGGVLRSLDAGASFTAPSLGLDQANVQGLSTHPNTPWRVVAVVGHQPWLSTDGGTTWAPMDAPFDYVASAQAYDRGTWLVGRDGEVAWRGWTRPSWWLPPGDSGGGRLSQVVLDGEVTKCVSDRAAGAVRCLAVGNAAWQTLLKAGEATMTGVVQDGAGTLVVGHGARLLESSDQGGTWTVSATLADDRVHLLARTPDKALLAGTRAGRLLLRSGGTWTDLGVQLPAAPEDLAPRPDFDRYPQVLVGTWAGTFVVDVAAGTLAPFAALHWVDDRTDGVCSGCATEPLAGASFGRVSVLPDGLPTGATVQGEAVAVRGWLPVGALLQVQVRDPWGEVEAEALVRGPTDGVTELLRVEVDAGWHRVVLVGAGGARLDVILGEGPWAPLPVERAPVPADGCGTVGAGPWWLLLLPTALRRRSSPRRRTRR